MANTGIVHLPILLNRHQTEKCLARHKVMAEFGAIDQEMRWNKMLMGLACALQGKITD